MKLTQKIAVGYLQFKFNLLSRLSPRKAAQEAFTLFCTPQTRNKKILPAIFEQAEELQFIFEQDTILGYRWNKGAGKKALIIHGFESSVVNFEMYIDPLISKGYEVLAFDAPAHGRSGGRRINALKYRDFIKDICDKYGPVQSFLSHSFGGLALCLALEQMQHDDTCRVVLIAPATESTTAAAQLFQITGIRNATVKNEFEKIILAIGGHGLSWFSVARTLPAIKGRILWLHDENDPVTPLSDVLKIDKTAYPRINFIITKGLGHSRIYRDKEVGKTIANFL